jgi:predicted Fe-Mo cluster-binding NifX family protein
VKIAVESDDGVKLSLPYHLQRNFMVFEIDEKSDPISIGTSSSQLNHKNQLKHLRNISRMENIVSELSDCSTVISHFLNRPLVNNLRKSGVDVYITFKDKVDDALNQYFKDEFIHNFH